MPARGDAPAIGGYRRPSAASARGGRHRERGGAGPASGASCKRASSTSSTDSTPSTRSLAFDVFGRSTERRLEYALVDEYHATIESLLPELDSAHLPLTVRIASVPERIRGFGHVKLAAVATARARTLKERWVRGELDARADAAAEAVPGAAGERIVQVVRRPRATAG
jgi:hypothetical protein